jgi:hypothetical protein
MTWLATMCSQILSHILLRCLVKLDSVQFINNSSEVPFSSYFHEECMWRFSSILPRVRIDFTFPLVSTCLSSLPQNGQFSNPAHKRCSYAIHELILTPETWWMLHGNSVSHVCAKGHLLMHRPKGNLFPGLCNITHQKCLNTATWRVTKITDSRSDDWIFLALRLQFLLITINRALSLIYTS